MRKFDELFARQYDKRSNNCFDLVCDYYQLNFDLNIRDKLPSFDSKSKLTFKNERKSFLRLDQPINDCLCVFRPYNAAIEPAHVGVYHNGEVFHIDDNGVKFTPLSVMQILYKTPRFYEVLSDNLRR